MRMHSSQRRAHKSLTFIFLPTLLLNGSCMCIGSTRPWRVLSRTVARMAFFKTVEAVCFRLWMSAQQRSEAAMDPASRQHHLVGADVRHGNEFVSQHRLTRDRMDSTGVSMPGYRSCTERRHMLAW